MFLEISESIYESLKEVLHREGIFYEVSDCTIPGETERTFHLEFEKTMTTEQISLINNQIDIFYEKFYKNKELVKDKNENGVPDYLEPEDKVVEKRRHKWDDTYHTPKQEFLGFFTGKNEEEEIVYERATE